MKIHTDDLKKICVSHFGVTLNYLIESRTCKRREFHKRRALVYFIMRKYMNFSYTKIGKIFMKDHTTILSAIHNINLHGNWEAEADAIIARYRKDK